MVAERPKTGLVKDATGREYSVSHVLAVPAGSEQVEVTEQQVRCSVVRDEKKRRIMEPYANRIYQLMGDRNWAWNSSGKLVKEAWPPVPGQNTRSSKGRRKMQGFGCKH